MALKGTLAKIDGVGTSSVALGESANAAGNYSVAIGYNAKATAANAIAIGRDLSSAGVAIGHQSSSLANGVAVGYSASAGNGGVSVGYQSASAANGTAVGGYAKANYIGSTAIGYNASAPSANTIMIGSSAVSNVYMKGSTSNVVTSDELDKTNIHKLEDGALNFINQIQPITYYYNYRMDYQEREEWTTQNICIDDENLIFTYEICNISKKEREKRYKYGGLGTYNKEEWEKGTKSKDKLQVGFKAQEIKQMLQQTYGNKYSNLLVNDICQDFSDEELLQDNAERQYGLAEGDLIPFLVKAVQELNTKVDILKIELANKKLKKVN